MGLDTDRHSRPLKVFALLVGTLALAGCSRGTVVPPNADGGVREGASRVMEAPSPHSPMDMPAWYREAVQEARAEASRSGRPLDERRSFVRGYW